MQSACAKSCLHKACLRKVCLRKACLRKACLRKVCLRKIPCLAALPGSLLPSVHTPYPAGLQILRMSASIFFMACTYPHPPGSPHGDPQRWIYPAISSCRADIPAYSLS